MVEASRCRRPAMPVTAKLSKMFYDRLGEAVTNELVDWFNQVDTAYRSDLREINEANFARFDAKLERRLAEFREDINGKFDALRLDVKSDINRLETTLERGLKEQTRFYFLAWAVLLVSNIALWLSK
jgi:hypothetical protein